MNGLVLTSSFKSQGRGKDLLPDGYGGIITKGNDPLNNLSLSSDKKQSFNNTSASEISRPKATTSRFTYLALCTTYN